MQICIIPGSFDPLTNGHLYVIKKASEMFKKVIIVIGNNKNKKRRFEKNIMKDAIKKLLEREKLLNVEVEEYDGLIVEAAKKFEANVIVRAVRNAEDFQKEETDAKMNEELGVDTIYLRAQKALEFLSSTFVYDLLGYGKDVSKYVPKEIFDVISTNKKQRIV